MRPCVQQSVHNDSGHLFAERIDKWMDKDFCDVDGLMHVAFRGVDGTVLCCGGD